MLLSACSGTGQSTVPQTTSKAVGSFHPMDAYCPPNTEIASCGGCPLGETCPPPTTPTPSPGPDVAVGGNGDVFVQNGGNLYQSTNGGASFASISGSAVDIAADPSGNLWAANSADAIYKWNGSSWQSMPGQATDIAIGGNGTVWALSPNCSNAGGCTIYRSTDGGQTYSQIPGYAKSISADANGNAWITNDSGSIYYYNGSSFVQVSGTGSDIAVAPNGTIWVLSNGGCSSTGCGIWYSTNKGASFTQVSGLAIDIAVDANNIPWVMNGAGNLYKATDATASGWTAVPF